MSPMARPCSYHTLSLAHTPRAVQVRYVFSMQSFMPNETMISNATMIPRFVWLSFRPGCSHIAPRCTGRVLCWKVIPRRAPPLSTKSLYRCCVALNRNLELVYCMSLARPKN